MPSRLHYVPRQILFVVTGGVLTLALAAGGGCEPEASLVEPVLPAAPIEKIDNPHLHNLHRMTATVYAGAQPDGEAAFRDLQALGVKIVISVDGAVPDQTTAAKFGLRYIHWPIGYAGVPVAAQQAIAKTIVEAEGNIYIHCHHGKHRGAAAAAAGCRVAGRLDAVQAQAALKAMQTGENYRGLWQDVQAAQAVPVADLRALAVEYKAAQAIPALTQAMVRIDEINERLQACRQADWRTPELHPDLDPAHEALQLKEAFVELQRVPDVDGHSAEFLKGLQSSEKNANELEQTLRAWRMSVRGPGPRHSLLAPVNAAWDDVQQNCLACHKQYRNVPQRH